MENTNKAILVILDGWGLGITKTADAIQNANVPCMNNLLKNYPHATLITFGEQVGLPKGQMGNSEVGHLNLGAGRVVYQELQRINVAVENNELNENKIFNEAATYARDNNKAFHLMGLVSDGGVHSHSSHLLYLLKLLHEKKINKVLVHCFTDGRDTDPKSGLKFVETIQQACDKYGYKIASISGRYYAMDRDKRWERVKLAYDCLTKGIGQIGNNALEIIQKNYTQNITDEFIKPTIILDGDKKHIIQNDDVVFCFNFRTDRCREISQALTQDDNVLKNLDITPLKLRYITMTEYDKSFKNVEIIFKTDDLKNTIGEVLEQNNKKQIRIAETEKYPHVTFFFSGGREKEFVGEKRIMIPSPKVATYDLQPEMSATEITAALLPEIKKQSADFICLNFANADMVGHTGVFNAVIKAVETVDKCLAQIIDTALQNDYTLFIIADHGNADHMINDDGSPNTAHSVNLVPLIVVDNDKKWKVKNGRLGDIAPSILKSMNINIPTEMTGEILISL